MDINKSRKKNSRKCYKKTTKCIKTVQKHTVPKKYHSRTKKLVHQSIRIANLQTEKFPAVYQVNPETYKYDILQKRFAVKELGKNVECISNSQEQACRCEHTYINRCVIVPSNNALKMDGFNKSLKKKEIYSGPYPNPVPVVNDKLFDTKSFEPKISTNQSKENVCIMNNELNHGHPLLFQCSDASLQLEQPKITETKKTNLNESLNSKQTSIEKKENYNNLSYILPKLMQQVTVYRMLENLKERSYQSNSEDNMYSSMSTCSSSSSTREYYLPAVSSSTDTMHVANVLANRKLVEPHNPQEETISKQKNSNQGICKNSYYKNNSNLSPAYKQASLKNEILPFNNIGMKEVGLDVLKKSSHQIIKMLKDNNDGLLPFFPFTNFNSLVIKNKSRVIKNYEQSSIGVQTHDNKIYEKDDDDSIIHRAIKNKRIKLSKENFVVNNKTKNNESLDITMEKTKSLVTNQNCENFMSNFNNSSKEVIKILNEKLYDTYLQANGKEKIRLNCNGSNSNLSNISMSKPKNRSISEDVLNTINDKDNKVYQTKKEIHKPKSSLCFTDMKPELPLHYKSYSNDSHDSLNVPKPRFVKLNPFFDAGFKDPKISRLILSSKTLAGESDSTIDKAKIQSNFTDNNADISKSQSKEKYVKSARISQTATISAINENKLEVKHSCTSNRSVFSADSIIYGSNAFQKIREKFNLVKNKIQLIEENRLFQEQGPLNKGKVFTPQYFCEESFECQNSSKDNSQSVYNDSNMNITALNNNFLLNENSKKVSTVSFENERISDKKKYLLLLPKKSGISNHQSGHSVNELRSIDETEKTTSFSSIHGKSVGISISDDEHGLPNNINLTSNSSKSLKTSKGKKEITKSEKGTIDTQYLSEKQIQVNMYLVETAANQVGDVVSYKMSVTENEKTSAGAIDNVAQTAMLDDNTKAEETMLNKDSYTEAIMLNNNDKAVATISNNNGQAEAIVSNYNDHAEATVSNSNAHPEATMLNNYGQPVILYNSSGYPITDLNGRVLKNNLGAYLLNSDKYSDLITKQLPVFDCDLMSVSSSCFNPTKVPFIKTQLKITDRSGNPISLFNNVGWPLTNEMGFFLHDNHGKLLVVTDSFNFPLCCSNGSPVYLQNGAMLLSQKFKFIVTKAGSDSNSTIRSLKIGRRHKNEVVTRYNEDDKVSNETTMNCSKTIRTLNEPNRRDFKSSNFRKAKERKPNFKYDMLLPTEVPELMHEFFDNKARPKKFSNLKRQGSIPQSPIPIFDREGNKLTDENGFPLKNKYGEYMLLLDKNGIALSDSCGGPIFDSKGKQLWLKDLYHMKKCPFNSLYDRYTPPEHPYIDTSTSNNNQIIYDSSEDEIPLLDINFENEQSSEPIMNYIKENNIKAYDMGVKQVHFEKNKSATTNRKPKQINFFKNVSMPTNEKYRLQSPMTTIKENVLVYETRSYQEEDEYEYLNEIFNQQTHDSNVPYTYEQSVYEDMVFGKQLDNLEQYGNNYYYHNHGFPQNCEFHQDAEVQYYVDENNYVMYY